MKPLFVSAAALGLSATSATAFAQNGVTVEPVQAERPSYLSQKVLAPEKALELTVETGYTQGFGMISSATSLPDVAGAGVGVGIGVGYRFTPTMSLSLDAQYQELTAERASGTRGLAGGIHATFHARPGDRIDPWLKAGVGYRGIFEAAPDPAPNAAYHGFDLVRLAVGADWRINPQIAISPMIGADLNLFLWQTVAGAGTDALADPRVGTFVFAGLGGRFDLGGNLVRTESEPSMARR